MKIKAVFSIICALVLALALPSPHRTGRAEEYSVHSLSMTGYITSSGVNIRSGPGTEHSTYGTAGAGDLIRVVSAANASDGSLWYYGQVNGISGWVHSAYVASSPVSHTAAPAAVPGTGANAFLAFTGTVTADRANVRSGASADTGVLAQLNYGARVTVLSGAMDTAGALWYYCEYSSGRCGYIRADLVASGTLPAAVPTAMPVVPLSFTGYANTPAVNVRSSPGGEKIGRLSEGARVSVTGEITADQTKWYRIFFSGGVGYVRADLISRSSPTAAPTVYSFTETPLYFTGLAVKNSCNVRRQPAYGADVLFRVNTGDALEVFSLCLDAGGAVWYHIRTADSRTGYILAELVSPASAGMQAVPGADTLPGGFTGTDPVPGVFPDAGGQSVPGAGTLPGGFPASVPTLVPDVGGGAYFPAGSAAPAQTPVPGIAGGGYFPAAGADPVPTLVPDVGGGAYFPADSAAPAATQVPGIAGGGYFPAESAAPAATPVPGTDGGGYFPTESAAPAATLVPDVGGGVYAPADSSDPFSVPQPTPFFVIPDPTPQPTDFFAAPDPTPQPTAFFVTSGPTARPTPKAPPPDMPSVDFSAFPSVPDQKLSVYSAPSVIAWRADGGSASVNTTDNMWCAGYDGQWLLILYHKDSGDTAVGYVSALSLRGAMPEAPSLALAACPAALARPADLTCDPLGQKGDSLPLKEGESVTWLGNCFLGSSWAYVETRVGGMPVRGFVPQDALQIQ